MEPVNYSIKQPMQLPWMFTSPSGLKGIEYHLSPSLSIQFDDIISGDMEFVISHVILGLEKMEVNELQAEEIFKIEYLPAKSKERVVKSLSDKEVSCFFTARQMEHLQKMFEERNFMSLNVSVLYKGKKVDHIAYLPPTEFELVYKAFEEFDVVAEHSHKKNRDKDTETYHETFKNQKKVASLEDRSPTKLWDRVKEPKVSKRIAKAVGSVAIGVISIFAQRRLANIGGFWSALSALVIGTIGVFSELYGRQEAQSTLHTLRVDKNDRGVFM